MAKRSQVRYVCSSCGAVSSTWAGRCSSCGEWNTITEEVSVAASNISKSSGRKLVVENLSTASAKDLPRIQSGIAEVDDILGGGLVPGSIVLIAGQPGIGKSTLLLQVAKGISENNPILYVSGEESSHQVAMRAQRLKAVGQRLDLATTTIADDIAVSLIGGEYKVAIVDSIQTMTVSALPSAAGSVTQISGSTQIIMHAAKQSNTAVIIVGHVTKEGSIAGPKVLEHIVDTVLQLEGDAYGGFKILRSSKNRFGSTSEVGIFEMTEEGLKTVNNPSKALLDERQVSDGSVVFAAMEGSRPLLVEVQALVNPSNYGYPKRTASGLDINRLNLLIAVLEKRTKLKLADQDIYVNIVGGLKLTEPAADLAVCMAIASAAKGMQLKANAVVFGEVGLSGEIRHVPFIEKRVNESKKLGFDSAIGPAAKGKELNNIISVKNVRDALIQFLQKD